MMKFRLLGRLLLEHLLPYYVLVSTPERKRYWGELPLRRSVKLLAAVFITFAGIAFFVDLVTFGAYPLWGVVVLALTLGVLHVAAIFAQLRNPWLLVVTLGLTWLSFYSFYHLPKERVPSLTQRRVILDGAGLLFAMMFGYRLFLNFAATEGIAHVQMKTELAFAQAIQTTLAPPVRYQHKGLEAYGCTRPSDAVGGDLVDLVESDGSVFAYVADVSGHGIPAGVLMGMVKTAMRQGLLFHQPLSSLLESLNRVLPGVKEPSMYATMACLRFRDPGKAEYAAAGHLPLLQYREAHKDVLQWTVEQFPLGLFPDLTFATQCVPCGTGDIFAIVTDGLTETVDEREEDFGLERLERLLVQNAGRTLPEIFDAVLAAVSRYGSQQDDRTLLLVRILG
jgi:serine phosphatase RsbU (regulator of sigma subunit)